MTTKRSPDTDKSSTSSGSSISQLFAPYTSVEASLTRHIKEAVGWRFDSATAALVWDYYDSPTIGQVVVEHLLSAQRGERGYGSSTELVHYVARGGSASPPSGSSTFPTTDSHELDHLFDKLEKHTTRMCQGSQGTTLEFIDWLDCLHQLVRRGCASWSASEKGTSSSSSSSSSLPSSGSVVVDDGPS